MGQKINPIGLRLGVNRTADSRWYADSADYGRLLHEDIKIRKYIKDKLKQAGVSRVIIERPHKKCRITVHTARPGMVIGKKGADIETLRKEIAKLCKDEVFVRSASRRPTRTWLLKTLLASSSAASRSAAP
jgi:small subunit ribosomal protein S3